MKFMLLTLLSAFAVKFGTDFFNERFNYNYTITYEVGDLLRDATGVSGEGLNDLAARYEAEVELDGWAKRRRKLTVFNLTRSFIINDSYFGHIKTRKWVKVSRCKNILKKTNK